MRFLEEAVVGAPGPPYESRINFFGLPRESRYTCQRGHMIGMANVAKGNNMKNREHGSGIVWIVRFFIILMGFVVVHASLSAAVGQDDKEEDSKGQKFNTLGSKLTPSGQKVHQLQ